MIDVFLKILEEYLHFELCWHRGQATQVALCHVIQQSIWCLGSQMPLANTAMTIRTVIKQPAYEENIDNACVKYHIT